MKVKADISDDHRLRIEISCKHPSTVAEESIDQVVEAIVKMIMESYTKE